MNKTLVNDHTIVNDTDTIINEAETVIDLLQSQRLADFLIQEYDGYQAPPPPPKNPPPVPKKSQIKINRSNNWCTNPEDIYDNNFEKDFICAVYSVAAALSASVILMF